MSLSIFDVALGMSWTNTGHFYLTQKNDKYELIVDYLNSANVQSLKNDIDRLNTFQAIRKSADKDEIENHIMNEIEGFNDRENGYSAYIAGAHDKSPSIQYNIQTDVLSLIHPNIPTLEKFVIEAHEFVFLAQQMIQILSLMEELKFRKN